MGSFQHPTSQTVVHSTHMRNLLLDPMLVQVRGSFIFIFTFIFKITMFQNIFQGNKIILNKMFFKKKNELGFPMVVIVLIPRSLDVRKISINIHVSIRMFNDIF